MMKIAPEMAVIMKTKTMLRHKQHLFSLQHVQHANSAMIPKSTKPIAPMMINILNAPNDLETGLSPM